MFLYLKSTYLTNGKQLANLNQKPSGKYFVVKTTTIYILFINYINNY